VPGGESSSTGGSSRGGRSLVSVVIPCFDAADTIERALRSARAQTHRPLELIAVDDASRDATRDRLRALAADDLRVVALDRNVGVAEARNRGLALARGEYVAFLDADDEWLPEKLSVQIAALEQDASLALSTCDSLLVDVDGSATRHHTILRTASGPDAWRMLLRANFVPTPTVVTRRALLETVGGFDARLALGEDYDVWLKLAARGGVHVHPDVLVRIHARPEGLSRTLLRGEIDYVLPMIERHLDALASRLAPGEARSIRGQHFFDIALRARQAGLAKDAARLFAASIRSGHRVPKSGYQIALCGWAWLTRSGRASP